MPLKKVKMNYKDLTGIVNKTVQAFPNTDCIQINGFAVQPNYSPNQAAAGKTKLEYYRNEFWSRKWVASGEDETTMALELPAIFLSKKHTRLSSPDGKSICEIWQLSIVGTENCTECGDCKKTKMEAEQSLLHSLIAVKVEIQKNNIYDLNGVKVWQTAQEAALSGATNKTVAHKKWMTEIYENPFAPDNLLSFAVDIEICDCINLPTFNYHAPNTNRPIVAPYCSTC
jgi:hypothetical protein